MASSLKLVSDPDQSTPIENPGLDMVNNQSVDSKANILVVDDREDKRLAIEAIISDLGQNIIKAGSGRDALRYLLEMDFAVILLDVNMPGMDGFETAFLIRQKKNLEHVPIIFVTAVSDNETHLSRGYSLGAVDYILTPVMPDVLRTKVSVFVELFNTTQQVRRQAERLRQARDELEMRVKQRTNELAVVNASLQVEVVERKRVEEEIRLLNSELEQRILDRTAELRTANEELETFTYSIAHDLRAPLRQIHGFSKLLDQELESVTLSETARKYLNRIGQRGQIMGQMVDDLLSLSRITKQDFDRQQLNLNSIVGEVVAGIKMEIGDRKIEWRVGDLPTVMCGPGLIRQAFTNLISNAVKYTRPRSLAVIEIGKTSINNEMVIYVRDNGVGFNMAHADKLFGVFQRLHSQEAFEGTGVGLAVVARVIRKHGGKVWAEAKENEGATFYFTLGNQVASTNRQAKEPPDQVSLIVPSLT